MDTIKKGTTIADAVLLLQELLSAAGFELAVDGKFGPQTDRMVRRFQTEHDLVVDGIVGPKTWQKLMSVTSDHLEKKTDRFLSEDDLRALADQLGLELALVKAVNEVESGGHGFIGDKPVILFEGHILWNQLKKHGLRPEDHIAGNEMILFPRWTRDFYLGGLREYDRLETAKRIHPTAALESCSWGLFQIMGNNWEWLDYSSVEDFVRRMHLSEGEHIDAFGRFISKKKFKGVPLVDHLRNRDWAAFAEGYNGRGFRQNKYDTKLKRAFRKYKKEEEGE